MALKFSNCIARTAASNFSVLNKSPPSVLPAFSHMLCVRLARLSSTKVMRDGRPPTHFSPSETVITNSLAIQIRAVLMATCTIKLCCQHFIQYYCSILILKSNMFKTACTAASIYAATSMRNKNDKIHRNTVLNTCIKMFTMHFLHQVCRMNAQ
jgi:hypothetical protein